MLKITLFTALLGATLLSPLPVAAQMRPDPLGYSGLFWPNYAIWGRRVTKRTKFGVLVCEGAGYRGNTHRVCYWR